MMFCLAENVNLVQEKDEAAKELQEQAV